MFISSAELSLCWILMSMFISISGVLFNVGGIGAAGISTGYIAMMIATYLYNIKIMYKEIFIYFVIADGIMRIMEDITVINVAGYLEMNGFRHAMGALSGLLLAFALKQRYMRSGCCRCRKQTQLIWRILFGFIFLAMLLFMIVWLYVNQKIIYDLSPIFNWHKFE